MINYRNIFNPSNNILLIFIITIIIGILLYIGRNNNYNLNIIINSFIISSLLNITIFIVSNFLINNYFNKYLSLINIITKTLFKNLLYLTGINIIIIICLYIAKRMIKSN